MKKTLKCMLCCIMALVLILTLVACTQEKKTGKEETEHTTVETTQKETTQPVEEEKTLVGKWTAQVDLADYISDMTYDIYGVDMIYNPCILEITLTFEEDGTYKGKLKDKFDDAIEELDEEFVDSAIHILAHKAEMSVEQFERQVKATGQTREEYAKAFAEGIMTFMYGEVTYVEDELEGKWLLEGDELCLDKRKPEKADPIIIALEDDTFTVTEITEDEMEVSDYFLPLVFKRV